MTQPHGALGRAALAALLFIGSVAAVAAQSKPPTPTPTPAQIDRNGVLILIRTAILALNAANETGNYTVLRDLGSPNFRDANTAARLAEIFASQRAQKLDLSGIAVLEPQLTLLPQIEANGMMHMAGFFPSVPLQINFELLYAPVESRWRLYGLSVNVGSAAPVAPAPPPAPAVQASDPKRIAPKPAARPTPTHPEPATPPRSAPGPAETPPAPPQP